MNGYIAFYRGGRTEVYAKTSLEAQQAAAKFFKTKHTWKVHVVLAEDINGKPVVHKTSDL